jgi:peptide-methionine (S)-S-oxide reductase
MWFLNKATTLPDAASALPGRDAAILGPITHYVLKRPLQAPYPEGTETVLFGMGCFWGAERKFWSLPGVWITAVGYAGGHTPNPTYEETCSGRTGHTEAVLVAFDPGQLSFQTLLKMFWENHDPTQGMRQGNDIGTQYRSAIYATTDKQLTEAMASRQAFEPILTSAGYPAITTEISGPKPFYFAEDYHQQYLAKNPGGYCGLGGTGMSCPIGLTV